MRGAERGPAPAAGALLSLPAHVSWWRASSGRAGCHRAARASAARRKPAGAAPA